MDGKGAGMRNSVWLVFPCPASPPSAPTSLLVPSMPQGTLWEPFPIPRPGGALNNSSENSGRRSRFRAWWSEDTALQMGLWVPV